MPQLQMRLPEVPDTPWQDVQHTFSGAWMPDSDPALIGPENFADIQNIRYKDRSLEGVGGYTLVNSTAITDYTNVRNGHQLITPFTTTSYNLVHAINSSDQGRVYQNQTTIGSEGDFEATHLHADASTGLTGRFSDAPQSSVVYCNGEESMIWSGDEHRLAAAFQGYDHIAAGIIDVTDDINNSLTTDTIKLAANRVPFGDMETNDGWDTDVATPTTSEQSSEQAHAGTYSWKFVADAADDGIKSDTFSLTPSTTYRFSAWVYSTTDTAVDVKLYDQDGTEATGNGADTQHTIEQDKWNNITFTWTTNATADSGSAAVEFRGPSAGTWYVDDVVIVPDGYYDHLVLMTTRPIQGVKFYVQSANTTASDIEVSYWDGSDYTAAGSVDDSGTNSPAGTALGQTGSVTFDSTEDVAKPRHFQELFLYSYDIHFTENTLAKAELYQITVNMPFQTIKDVWDGVYRQPVQFQVFSTDHYEDYTLQVNQSSDVNTPVGGQLDGLVSGTDYVIVMFEDQAAGMRWTMLGDLVNSADAEMSVSYWNGVEYTAVNGLNDGTAVVTDSLAQTGLISWTTPSDEEKQTLFGTVGYAYKIEWDANLSGTKGSTAEVLVDIVYGIPIQHEVNAFDFSVLYKSRVMLGSFSAGKQGNRMDFCAANAPDVWNGFDSSDDGKYSLFFGNEDNLTAATQLYNRFGSNVFAMLLVLKAGETYILTGDTPDDFQIFPVSLNVGCPAPQTLATAEMGFEAGEGLQRQVAIWVSHSGPVMFDGAIMRPLRGVDLYFDPLEDEFVNWDAMTASARGWVDHVYKEYNLLIPTGSETTNNVWLVYDLIRRKWFKKDTGTAQFPQSGWPVTYSSGRQAVFGGIDTGYMIHLEEGTSWAATYADASGGSGIEQKVRTGDFFPSNNIWDNCLLRKFKLITEKISATATINLNINYYENAANSASNVVFQDADTGLGTNVDFENLDSDGDGVNEVIWASAAEATLQLNLDIGTDRLVRIIQDLNQLGWSHSFEFAVTTTDVEKGFRPIAWGVRYRIERKDDTATSS